MLALAILFAAGPGAAALAQNATVNAPSVSPASSAATKRSPPAATNQSAAPAATGPEDLAPNGGTALHLRGLDKITGRPTDIFAPIGKTVTYATLTITARYCYSTPPSETPETAAFLQIDDRRPDQAARKLFSGWMYASSPSLNAMDHPTYDVWVIGCNNNAATAAVGASTAPVKVRSPDSSDKETVQSMPEGAGR
jgi:hypothetical protein